MHSQKPSKDNIESPTESGYIPFTLSKETQTEIQPIKSDVHQMLQNVYKKSNTLDTLIARLRGEYMALGSYVNTTDPETLIDDILDEGIDTTKKILWPNFSVVYSPIMSDEFPGLSWKMQAYMQHYRRLIEHNIERFLQIEEHFLGQQIDQEAKNLGYWQNALHDVMNTSEALFEKRTSLRKLDFTYDIQSFLILQTWQKIQNAIPGVMKEDWQKLLNICGVEEFVKTYTQMHENTLQECKQIHKRECLGKHLSHWHHVSGDAQKVIYQNYNTAQESLWKMR